MICASVPLQDVSAHLDETLGDDDEGPPTIRQDPRSFVFVTENEPLEPAYLLTTLRPSAA